jgi:hypothetical protein
LFEVSFLVTSWKNAVVSEEIPHEEEYEASLMPVSGGKKAAKNQLSFAGNRRPFANDLGKIYRVVSAM